MFSYLLGTDRLRKKRVHAMVEAFGFEVISRVCSQCCNVYLWIPRSTRLQRSLYQKLLSFHIIMIIFLHREYLSDLCCRLESIHHRHLTIHEHQTEVLIILFTKAWINGILVETLLHFFKSLLSIHCLLHFQIELDLENSL